MGQEIFDSSGTWINPGVATVDITECTGAAGGGGINSSGEGGGAGGACATKTSVAVGASETVTVGIYNGHEVAGGDSWFATAGTVLGKGGPPGIGGTGGLGTVAGSIGDTVNRGGNGANTPGAGVLGGGGGAGAAPGVNGGDASGQTGGTGGGGQGGDGGGSGANGANGSAPGGAPGGGGNSGGTSGTGASGRVIVSWVDPPPPSVEVSAASSSEPPSPAEWRRNNQPIDPETGKVFKGIRIQLIGRTGPADGMGLAAGIGVVHWFDSHGRLNNLGTGCNPVSYRLPCFGKCPPGGFEIDLEFKTTAWPPGTVILHHAVVDTICC